MPSYRVVIFNKVERVTVSTARNVARVVLGVQGPPGTSENIDCGTF